MISKREVNRNKTNTKAGTVTMTDDSGNYRNAMISSLGKNQKCQVLSPYGLCSNPPDNSLAALFNLQGIAANTIAIVDDPKNRKKNLAKGEVALYNYTSGSLIHLKEDGTVIIDNNSGSIVTLSPSGVVNIEASTTNITSTTAVNIEAPTVTITGATSLDLVSSTAINLTAPVINTNGVFTNIGLLTATDFKTGTIDSINAHGHAPGTFVDAEARPITGKSGAPS